MKLRYDKAQPISSVTKTKEGYLEIIAPIAKVGVMNYLTTTGHIIKEYVPESTLFDEESTNSLKLKPVTFDHPEEFVDSNNFSNLAKGFVAETTIRDSNLLRVKFTIMDSETISKVESGEFNELSPGYLALTEDRLGVTEHGEAYDSIQLKRVYNHLALVNSARGGHDLKIKFDSIDFDNVNRKTGGMMSGKKVTIRIDGLDHEVENEAIAKHIASQTTHIDDLEAKVTSLEGELTTSKANLDSANAEISKLKSVNIDEEVSKRVDSRIELLTKAAEILGDELNRKDSDLEIKKAVITKIQPSAKFDALDPKTETTYINARFDACIDLVGDDNSLQRIELRGDANIKPRTNDDPAEKRCDSLQNRWNKEGGK